MGLIICRRCGNAYDRERWDECPHCARQNLIPRPYSPTPFRMSMSEQAPSSSWAEVMSRGGHPLYVPQIAMRINITRR